MRKVAGKGPYPHDHLSRGKESGREKEKSLKV